LPPVVVPAPVKLVAATDLIKPPLLQRMIVGSWVLITINTLIFGFVLFLPQFFLRQGLTITNSLAYTVVLSPASLVGCVVGAWSSDGLGRRTSIIAASIVTIVSGYIYARFNAASDPAIVLAVGFILIVAIYVQTAILYGVYPPELFPTEIRLRANGICNMFGRGATVISPFIVGSLMASYGVPRVIWLMIGVVVLRILVVGASGVCPRNVALVGVAASGGVVASRTSPGRRERPIAWSCRDGLAKRNPPLLDPRRQKRWVTPEPVIGPRFARTRWANPPYDLSSSRPRHSDALPSY